MTFATALNFLGTKAFRYISGGLFLIIALWFFYDKFETAVTNNTILRQNLSEKDKQIQDLKSNLKVQELKHQEEIKSLKFKSKVETKKQETQKTVDTYKKPIKERPLKEKKNEIDIPNDNPVYFNL